jgi:uncharacterized membrane protein
MTTMRSLSIAGGLAGLAVLILCDVAWARLEICNKTGRKITVAIAYQDKGRPGVSTSHSSVTAEGWWDFGSGECAKISDVDTAQNWVWYFAHGGGREWGGNSRLCVRSDKFTSRASFLMRDETCRPPAKAHGFGRIDTDKRNFVLTLN